MFSKPVKSILILLAGLLISACQSAEKDNTRTHSKADQLKLENQIKITETALKLTSDSLQFDNEIFEKLKTIFLDFDKDLIEIKNQSYNDPETKGKKIKQLNITKNIDLRDILPRKDLILFNKMYSNVLQEVKRKSNEDDRLSSQEREALSKEIIEFRNETVAPFLISKRKDLESLLSQDHKSKISDLRNSYASYSASIKMKQEECKIIKDRIDKMACNKEMATLRNAFKEVKRDLSDFEKEIVNSHPYTEIFSTINTESNKWSPIVVNMLNKVKRTEVKSEKISLERYFRLLNTQMFILANVNNN